MSAESVGQIGLDLVVNQEKFNKQLKGIDAIAAKAGKRIAAAFGIKKLIDFGKSAVDLGSDLQEVQNVVDVTFPNMSAQVDKFAKKAASSFGLSETMAKKYTGTFGAMAKAFGFSEKAAYEMSTSLTGLAGDVASFYNLNQDEAYTKLKSVFTGETESLKDLGVVMTQTALDSYAMANGFGKTTKSMTEAEKVALRYAFVQNQLAIASGDFIRTSDGWANQVRILQLQFESLKATIGQGLINVLTPVIKVINIIIGKLMTLANAFKAFTDLITGKKSQGSSGVKEMASAAGEAETGLSGASSAADDMTNSAKKAGGAAKKAAKEMKSLMGFDSINKLSESSDSGGSGGGSGGGGGGASGGGIDFGSLAEGGTVLDKVDGKITKTFEKIQKLVQPTIDAFKRLKNEGFAELEKFTWKSLKDFYHGFMVPIGKWTLGKGLPSFIDTLNNGLLNIQWNKINNSLRKLWDALAPFSIKVGEGLLWLWENALVPLGTWTANEVVPRFLNTMTNIVSAFNSVLEALQPSFQKFWDAVLLPITNWTGGAFEGIWDEINNTLLTFSDWCKNNPSIIQTMTTAVAGFFGVWKIIELFSFIQISGGVIAALKGIATALFGTTAAKLADKVETMALNVLYAKDFVVSMAKGTDALIKQTSAFIADKAAKIAGAVAQKAMTAAIVAWNTVCTIATTLTKAFSAAVAFLTSPIGIAITIIGGLTAAGVLLYKNWDVISAKAKEVWTSVQNKLKEFDDYLQGIFMKDWTKSFGIFENVLNGFLTNVKNIWNSIKTVFSGITTFISGAFSGDWKKAWQGLQTVFQGIWNGMVSFVKSPINKIIGYINSLIKGVANGMNAVIRSLNKLSFKIPSWVPEFGGKKFGVNLSTVSAPQIPKLAKGAYVKPNTPQLAMIGDNRHQGEVVAPEDKLTKMAIVAARAAVANSSGITKQDLENIVNAAVLKIVAALTGLGFYIDSELIALAVQKGMESLDRRYNPVEFI